MKTVETENQGLKRSFMLTIPAKDIDARVDQEIKRIAPQVRMPGFRPGKVPPNLIRKMHGEALQQDALSTAVQQSVQQLLNEQKLRPAMQPQVELGEGYEPGKDAEVKVSLETLPDVPKPKIDNIRLERLTVDVDEAGVQEQLKNLASSQKSWKPAPKAHKAAHGDLVVMDYVGTVDGEPFEGGTGEGMSVEIGSGSLILGFEEGLVGAKAGDQREVSVTFPDDYPVENLKGKAAKFAVKVIEVKTAGETKVDEEFAKSLGLSGLDQLKSLLKDQQQQELNQLTRTHMKRRLLDQLAERHDFPVPPSMVDAEYNNIMAQLRHEASHEADPKAALAEIEAEAEDYRKIAERRVRLGLVLAQIGEKSDIKISDDEVTQALIERVRQYPGQERQVWEFYQKNPQALAEIRAPLFEEKVVDQILSQVKVNEETVSKDALFSDEDEGGEKSDKGE